MAFSLNRAQVIGNVTRDPEVRTTTGGQKVASFSVATNFAWTDQATGQKKEKVEYHNIVAWRKLAEICEQYLKKGRKVFVEGRLQTRDWEGEDGVKRFRTEITAENVILLDRPGQSSGGSVASGVPEKQESEAFPQKRGTLKKSPAAAQTPAAEKEAEEVNLEDLPF